MVSAPGQYPSRVVVHNKSPDMNEAEVIGERIQERVVFELAKVNSTPGRISEGESWYIEPCAGIPLDFNNGIPVKEIAACSARLHKASNDWFEEWKPIALEKHP